MGCHCHDKKIVRTDKAPEAVGPYSVGAIGSNLVFTSGQIGLDPKTQELVQGGISSETVQVLTNIKNILEGAGSSLDQVVKVTVFIKDLNDFPKMNEVYSKYFPDNSPARSAVQVAGLPKSAAVMIDAVGVVACSCDCEGGCKCGDDCECGKDDKKDKCCG